MGIFGIFKKERRTYATSMFTPNGKVPLIEGITDDSLRLVKELLARKEMEKLDAMISSQPEIVKYLDGLLTDDFVGRDAAWKLAEFFAKNQEWEKLDKLLRHTNTVVRSSTAWSLSAVAEKGISLKPVHGALEWGTTDRRGDVKQQAAKALISDAANNGSTDTEAVIEKTLSHPKEYVRENMVASLGDSLAIIRMRNISLKMLCKALESKHTDVQESAIAAIASAAEKGIDITLVMPTLATCLSSSNIELRKYASWALGNAAKNRVDIHAAVSALGQRLSDKDPIVRLNCSWALESYSERNGDVTLVMEDLAGGLGCRDERVRLNCARALVNAAGDAKKGEKSVNALSAVLSGNSSRMAKETASWALLLAVEMGCDITNSISALAEGILVRNEIISLNCSWALLFAAEMGLKIEPALEALAKAAVGKKELVKLNAVATLFNSVQKGAELSSISEKIKPVTTDDNPEIRWMASEILMMSEPRKE